jgi:DNA polymerase III delta subunit
VAELKPSYLITGDDEGKIDAALGRLRARAEKEGGAGALESFSPQDGAGAPDLEGLAAAIPAMSLTAARRFLVADRLDRSGAKPLEALAGAMAKEPPPDLTIVLVERPAGGRERPSRARTAARKTLVAAIETGGGEVLEYAAPNERDLPGRLVSDARKRGFELDADAAKLLVERMGARTGRLANELDRLALWAGPGGAVTVTDLEAMVADTSEEVAWGLSDAIVDRDAASAVAAVERLATQGESVTGLIYQAAKRLRAAGEARARLDGGQSQKDVEGSLKMHPYAAKMLVRSVRDASLGDLRAASCALADLEWWTRGGADYPEEVAVTVAVRRAAGAP